MKKLFILLISLLVIFSSCEKKDDNNGSGNNQNPSGNMVTVSEDLTANTIWKSDNQYLIDGPVHVKSGCSLTIEPGTIIKGNTPKSWLVVERGAKIIAEGTKSRPIIFTSNKPAGQRAPGDWAGIQICGYGIINQLGGESEMEGGTGAKFGGSDNSDNSGILRYIRIEFAGYEVSPGNELNGLSLGAVGSGTTIEHIQVSYGKDDSFEWWGGAVNCKYLISFRGGDDDFDTDWGYSGKLQYGLAFRHPDQHDASDASNGFESDNDKDGSANTPFTSAIFSNFTLVGPLSDVNMTLPTQHANALRIRRNSEISLFNSVIVGWVNGVLIENGSANKLRNGELALEYNQMAGCRTDFKKSDDITSEELSEIWSSKHNVLKTIADLKFKAPYNYKTNGWIPQTGSTLLSGADFTNDKLSGFDKVNYIGAFDGIKDWTEQWTEWDPVNADYSLK